MNANHVTDVRVGASPVVKWVGGKTKLLPELVRRMPATFGRYYEPFAGGLALFFYVGPEHAVLSDVNNDLIVTYNAIALDVDAVIFKLEHYRQHHSVAFYQAVRAAWNASRDAWPIAERAAAFIYLNKTCFNGLWRVNKKGEFNVPMGAYKNPRILDVDALRAASKALASAEIRQSVYDGVLEDVAPGDFVYFDPPYDPVTKTSNFTAYSAGGFGDNDQRGLAEIATILVARGVRVMLSNSDTAFVRELYSAGCFRIDRVKAPRAINSDASKRGAVDEVIVTGGY